MLGYKTFLNNPGEGEHAKERGEMTKKELQEEFLRRIQYSENVQVGYSEDCDEWVFGEGWKQALRLAYSLLAFLDEDEA